MQCILLSNIKTMKISKLKFYLLLNFIILLFCLFFSSKNFASYEIDENYISYENLQTKEISKESFNELVIKLINDERSFRGLLPLNTDEIASKVAEEHAKNIVQQGYLSYYNLKKCPDERYTLAGGTGLLIEIIKAFERAKHEKNIVLSELLASHFIQAINLNSDDLQILYSPYITNIGFGFLISQNKKRFVAVLELITKGGDFDPIRPEINIHEKLTISGKVNLPYKFKAISIAFKDEFETENENIDVGFDSENLKPYFPPQNFIAFSDTSKANFMKLLKGLGFVGAIGASPFTGGVSSLLAPVFLTSLQGGIPKEIPLKSGIKLKSNGEFTGQVELNYQGKSGLYFVSVLAELPKLSYPIVISRRTVRVNNSIN